MNGEILVNNHGLSRKHIIEGLDASLERLQLDYVDIVYAHRPDRLTPMEETVRAFNYLIDNGKVCIAFAKLDCSSADEATRLSTGVHQSGLLMRLPKL